MTLSSPAATAVFIGLAATFAINMMGTTLPTPLYPIYQHELGFSELMITVIFAAYAVGVIAALIITGSWSDQIGRRPMLALGLLFSAASAAAFICGGALLPLLIGRLLSGFSAGIFTGTATVSVVEMAPRRWRDQATLVATAANMGGLGLGPFVAGVLAEYAPAPLLLCFVVDLLLIAVAAAVLWLAPETARRPDRPRLTIRKPGVPPEVRGVFIPAAIAGFAGFAVMGLFTAVAPAFLGKVLGYGNHALTGSVVFVPFIASIVGQAFQSRLPRAARLPLGCLGLIVGMGFLIAAIELGSLALMIVAGATAGAGQGASFRAGMGEITAASPAARRAEVASTFFVVAYIAISIPVVGLGLIARGFGLSIAGVVFASAVAVLSLISAVSLLIRQRRYGEIAAS
ncbi:MFS transporter [Salinisphaera sp.]|uniref:MFS transporter n=1 Tax=Salinisphaera sp. TaxID=1914330 RepID=UPI002D792A9F|nr:MFS transporter [Salinisphaera sp.]HET7314430.1 MFS transporter [Salinisphaera sp.]